MLTLARHLDAPLAGYSRAEHPVQRLIAQILRDMAGLAALPAPAIDGCGVPTWPIPLGRLAGALARFACPAALPAGRAEACARVQAAMLAHPQLVAGTDRACAEIMSAARDVLVKTGAEGVYAACLPRRRLGVVLKVEDGAGRAAPVALLALLRALGALDAGAAATLAGRMQPELRNHAGVVVGRIEPAVGWPALRRRS
jgi:L-asparaginase II